jgi:hypothetical protein
MVLPLPYLVEKDTVGVVDQAWRGISEGVPFQRGSTRTVAARVLSVIIGGR